MPMIMALPSRAHSGDLVLGRSHIARDIGSIVWTGDVWRTLPRTGALSRRVGRGTLRRKTGTCEADTAESTAVLAGASLGLAGCAGAVRCRRRCPMRNPPRRSHAAMVPAPAGAVRGARRRQRGAAGQPPRRPPRAAPLGLPAAGL